jgi:predicted peroxiredoxin
MSSVQPGTLLINLVSDRPANISKALRFGRKFLAAGWQVHLLINIDAVVLVQPDSDLAPCPLTGQPLSQQLQDFMGAGGDTLVGKECLKLAGIAEESLGEGLRIASFPLTEQILSIPNLQTMTW